MTSQEIDRFLSADRDVLVELWEQMAGQAPPSRLSRAMMAKILVTDFQWKASGFSRPAMMRKLEKAVAVAESAKPNASAGKRLIREWNGRQHIVDITPDGYVWNDRSWRSLSAIAKEITGTRWSGPRFFGVAG